VKPVPAAAVPTRQSSRNTTAPAPGAGSPPEATPAPKPPGFFKRNFGKKERKAVPVATPIPATPPPTTPRRRRSRPRATPEPAKAKSEDKKREEQAAESKPEKKEAADAPEQAEKPAESTPVAEAPAEKPTEPQAPAPATPAPGKKGRRAEAAAKAAAAKAAAAAAAAAEAEKKPQPPENADPETLEKWKYDQAKATAQQDGEVVALKEKADAAPSDDEARKALRAYNKALFARMRKADPSIKERVDRMETAVLKRLEEKASE
jgi:colicin import membrane protein